MRKLPKILKNLIKKKTFSLDTLQPQETWRGGVRIEYRITMVKANEEQIYEHLTPLNNEWGYNYVNIKVKVVVQTRTRHSGGFDERKVLVEIGKATKTRESFWGGYETKYDSLWGNQINKKVRSDIRSKVKNDIVNFLKLLGLTTCGWDSGIKIGTISWEE